MPLPWIIAAGIGLYALSKQRENKKLKEQIKALKRQIEQLKQIIEEKDRQIKELEIRYNTVSALYFTTKLKLKGKMKAAIKAEWIMYEYLNCLLKQYREQPLTEEEEKFMSYVRAVLEGAITDESGFMKEEVKEKYNYIKNYINKKYGAEIKVNMSAPLNKIIAEYTSFISDLEASKELENA